MRKHGKRGIKYPKLPRRPLEKIMNNRWTPKQISERDQDFLRDIPEPLDHELSNPEKTYEILQNAVVCVNFGQPIISKLLLEHLGSTVHTNTFAASRTRVVGGLRGMFLIFENGKIVSVGNPTKNVAVRGCHQIRLLLEKLNVTQGGHTLMSEFRYVNFVRNGVVDHSVDISKMHRDNTDNCSYDPELFPGCTMTGELGTYMGFDTGNFVLVGGMDGAESKNTITNIMSLLNNYKMPALTGNAKERNKNRIFKKTVYIKQAENKETQQNKNNINNFLKLLGTTINESSPPEE